RSRHDVRFASITAKVRSCRLPSGRFSRNRVAIVHGSPTRHTDNAGTRKAGRDVSAPFPALGVRRYAQDQDDMWVTSWGTIPALRRVQPTKGPAANRPTSRLPAI